MSTPVKLVEKTPAWAAPAQASARGLGVSPRWKAERYAPEFREKVREFGRLAELAGLLDHLVDSLTEEDIRRLHEEGYFNSLLLKIYHLRVVLSGLERNVWRRIEQAEAMGERG
jgi:hypothetical protein